MLKRTMTMTVGGLAATDQPIRGTDAYPACVRHQGHCLSTETSVTIEWNNALRSQRRFLPCSGHIGKILSIGGELRFNPFAKDDVEQMIAIFTAVASMTLPLGLPSKVEDYHDGCSHHRLGVQACTIRRWSLCARMFYWIVHSRLSAAVGSAAMDTVDLDHQDLMPSTAQWMIRSAPSRRRSMS
eukprot:1837949-Amphidinium_carterae.1